MLIPRQIVVAALVFVVVACGGGAQTTLPPGATVTPAGQPTPGPGEPLDAEAIATALTALRALDSWTFEVTTWTKSLGNTFEQRVSGTERTKPEAAIDAEHTTQGGNFHYIRIGDDLWTNLATDAFYHYDAADSENLIDQYEPLYVSGLGELITGFSRVDYEPVGTETINGMPTIHFRGSQADRENLVQSYSGITADQWAADVWLATSGGYVVRLAWGPQSLETAQASMGFLYDTTAVNCACPVEPPTVLAPSP